MIKVSPSLLSADFSDLKTDLAKLAQAGADYVHMDIMDGHFVNNITFGYDQLKMMKKVCDIPFDTHLMIENPDKYIEKFAESSDIITVHAEACIHLDRTIQLIHSCGCKAGVALCPSTDENVLKYVIDKIDLALVMSVNPGFGGQSFIESVVPKITRIKEMLGGRDCLIEVDGGINAKTAKTVVDAGANLLVAGSYVFGGDIKERIDSLREVK
ncbi:MAG: ribulose-phosphate 3-epimerase [Eubacteriaceae bacterium]|nr:ribulose-phosphate 3-epimerase [Eubacteriaceae bacterium]